MRPKELHSCSMPPPPNNIIAYSLQVEIIATALFHWF